MALLLRMLMMPRKEKPLFYSEMRLVLPHPRHQLELSWRVRKNQFVVFVVDLKYSTGILHVGLLRLRLLPSWYSVEQIVVEYSSWHLLRLRRHPWNRKIRHCSPTSLVWVYDQTFLRQDAESANRLVKRLVQGDDGKKMTKKMPCCQTDKKQSSTSTPFCFYCYVDDLVVFQQMKAYSCCVIGYR